MHLFRHLLSQLPTGVLYHGSSDMDTASGSNAACSSHVTQDSGSRQDQRLLTLDSIEPVSCYPSEHGCNAG